jgi:hypothetical protein
MNFTKICKKSTADLQVLPPRLKIHNRKISAGFKALFIIPTDAHNFKITGMLKQLKFQQLLRHVSAHAGTIIRELFRA